ncbi:MAG: DUF4332 domain-containing protein [Pseudomonadota bacterium]
METHLHALIEAHYCRSTHHYIVMDALKQLSGPDATGWYRWLLHERAMLLRGAKAPDAEFKDFKNHVLHVGGDAEWGGARGAATEWYGKAVTALRAKQWSSAAYALGVLSHYYADPIQPFHTGQTEAEGAVHRALEWSIFKSRPALKQRMDAIGFRAPPRREDTNFVSDMVGEGARTSHTHYDTFIDHYDLDAGAKRPEAGMDETLLAATAELLTLAVSGVAHLFERAFEEAGVAPKSVVLSLDVAVAEIGKPLRKILSKIEDAGTRRAVEAAYAEYQKTGKVIRRLSGDDAAIRALHAKEVRGISLQELDVETPKPIGAKHGRSEEEEADAPSVSPAQRVETSEPAVELAEPSVADAPEPASMTAPLDADAPEAIMDAAPTTEPLAEQVAEETSDDDADAQIEPEVPAPALGTMLEARAPRPGLTEESDVVDAPSIGKRTARHLRRAAVTTIGDLLNAEPETLAGKITQRHITAGTIQDWQDQTRLKMALPSLRVHDVQILVGAGIRSVDDLRAQSASELFSAATQFANTPAAERIIHDADKPTRDEVDGWISKANAQTG